MSKKSKSKSAGSTRGAPASSPHRSVVSLALMLFVPALWLALSGNLSVQTALFRFLGALLVSWVAAQVVLATVNSCTRAPTRPVAPGSQGPAGRRGSSDADSISTGSVPPGVAGNPGVAGTDVSGRPDGGP